jgi:hypothetical protein
LSMSETSRPTDNLRRRPRPAIVLGVSAIQGTFRTPWCNHRRGSTPGAETDTSFGHSAP